MNAATIEKIIQAMPNTREGQSAISDLLTGFDTEIESLQFQLEKNQSHQTRHDAETTHRTNAVDLTPPHYQAGAG